MITLIIVNCQNDFITGTVLVRGARTIVDEIKKFIKSRKDEIEKIVFALNWHPYNHSSFKKYGGQLPHHCIQYTPGACIEPKLLKFVQSLEINYDVSLIGELEEADQDGAFEDIEYVADNFGERYYLNIVEVNANSDFVICGIAGDIHVKATIQSLIDNGITPKVFCQGIVSTDGGKIINEFINENKLENVTIKEKESSKK